MNTLSNILGRPVISLYNGQIEGTIINASFDKKMQKIQHLLILNEPIENSADDLVNEIKVLPTRDVYNIGQDAVVIKNNNCIELYSSLEPNIQYMNPINSDVYTVLGTKLGKIQDIKIDDSFNVLSCTLDDNSIILTENMAVLGNGIVLMQDKDKVVFINRFNIKKPKIKETKEPIKILRNDTLFENNTVNTDKNTTALPLKLTGSADLLLGRVVTQTLYNQSKEIIAKKGNIITLSTVKNAKKNGKIKELYVFST